MADEAKSFREKVAAETRLRLGGQMIGVELDPEHYDLAIDLAVEQYRQRSSNADLEAFFILQLEANKSEYDLSEGSKDADITFDITEIRDVYSRSTGNAGSGVGSELEPFQAQYTNTFLQQSGRAGGLGVYEFIAQHYELIGRIFGAEYLYDFNRVTKRLRLHRRVKAINSVLIGAWAQRGEAELFADRYAMPWLKRYTLAQSKFMLGEARSKFAALQGPGGGTTLNGEALKQEAIAEIEKLEEDVLRRREGGEGWGFLIG